MASVARLSVAALLLTAAAASSAGALRYLKERGINVSSQLKASVP